nr:hypothetical protein [Tanacetum cinerariifolium]
MSRCIEKFRDVKKRVIDLEDELKKIKTTQQNKIDSLEKRVKNLEKKYNSRTHKLKRLAREQAQKEQEANADLINTRDDIQERINADYQFAEQLQVHDQEELTNAEKAKLFVKFLEKRRKFFAAKRDENKRNKPPPKAQQRKIIAELNKLMEIIPKEEEVAIDAITLAVRTLIVDWKIHKEDKVSAAGELH